MYPLEFSYWPVYALDSGFRYPEVSTPLSFFTHLQLYQGQDFQPHESDWNLIELTEHWI